MSEIPPSLFEGLMSAHPEIDAVLQDVATYVARKAVAARPGSIEDEKMKLACVRVQQAVVGFVLNHYNPQSPHEEADRIWLQRKLAVFWNNHRTVAVASLQQAFGELGLDPRAINGAVGARLATILEAGTRGMIAACLMAKGCGYGIKLPEPRQDVREGIDFFLIPNNNGPMVPVQVKCRQGMEFMVGPDDRNPRLIFVTIPDNKQFFRDYQIGVPRPEDVATFGKLLGRTLTKMKGGK